MVQPGPVTTTSMRPDLPSQSMSSTMGACQACGIGGVVPQSSVEITWISRQYQVSGWSGIFFLARDWDGGQDEVLPNASVSSGPLQPFGGVRFGPPSGWLITPDFRSSWSLNWAAIGTEMLTIDWNYWICPFCLGTKAHARRQRNNWVHASCV